MIGFEQPTNGPIIVKDVICISTQIQVSKYYFRSRSLEILVSFNALVLTDLSATPGCRLYGSCPPSPATPNVGHRLGKDLVLGLDLLLQVDDPLLFGGVVGWPFLLESRPDLPLPLSHSGYLESLALSRDGLLVVSASADTTLKVWDVEPGRVRTTYGLCSDASGSAAFTVRVAGIRCLGMVRSVRIVLSSEHSDGLGGAFG